MTWVAVAVVGASAVAGAVGAENAEDAATAASNRNLGYQERWNMQQDPFSAGGNRAQYVPQLNALMQGGIAGVAQDPAYQRFNAKSQEDMQRRLSAKGMGASGQEMIALGENAGNNMTSYFNAQYDRLAELSGTRRGGGQVLQGMSPGDVYNMQANQYQQVGNAIGSIGSIYGAGSGTGTGTGTGDEGTQAHWLRGATRNPDGSISGY